jgi:tetratricopeptide (TPR) repeat protein
MAIALFQCSRFDECIESAHKAAELSGVSYPLFAAGLAYASSGRRKQAIEVLERFNLESTKSYVAGIYPAILALRLARLVQAFSWFERAFNERDSGLVILKSLPSLEFARFIPGLRKYVRRMNFPRSA